MTTIDDPRGRPLREVFSPKDYEDVRRRLERGRWWRFLNAKEYLAALARKAGTVMATGAAAATSRLHLGGVAVAARRVFGWVAGKVTTVAKASAATGTVPMIAWAASTPVGRHFLTALSRKPARTVLAAGRHVARAANRVLMAFGTPGQQVSAFLAGARQRVRGGLVRAASQPALWAALRHRQFAGDLVAAWARQRVLRGLLTWFVPNRYARLARVALAVLAVPGPVRNMVLNALRRMRPNGSTWATATRTTKPTVAVPPRGRVSKPAAAHTAAEVSEADAVLQQHRADGKADPAATPAAEQADGLVQAAEPLEENPPARRRPPGKAGVRRQGLRFMDDEGTGSHSRYPAPKQRAKRR